MPAALSVCGGMGGAGGGGGIEPEIPSTLLFNSSTKLLPEAGTAQASVRQPFNFRDALTVQTAHGFILGSSLLNAGLLELGPAE